MKKIDNIVIGTSLGVASNEVVRASLEVARALSARVRLIHAVPIEPLAFSFESFVGPAVTEHLRQLERDDLARQLREVEILKHELISADVVLGTPHEALADAAAESSADLVIVAAAESETPAGRILGSTADRLIRLTTVPVLILRDRLPLPPRRVLAPIDLSPASAVAFDTGVSFLRQLPGTPATDLKALFVLSPLQRLLADQFTSDQIDHLAREELIRFVDLYTADWPGGLETALRIGDARREVLDELADFGAELAIVGSHGHGRHRRAMIGTVAARIARRSHCSVLFVPFPEPES